MLNKTLIILGILLLLASTATAELFTIKTGSFSLLGASKTPIFTANTTVNYTCQAQTVLIPSKTGSKTLKFYLINYQTLQNASKVVIK